MSNNKEFLVHKLVQILTPRFRCLDAEMNKRSQFEKLTPTERNDIRLLRLNEAWRLATRSTRYYSELCRRFKLPDQFSSFEEFRAAVPRTTKDSVRLDPDAFKIPGRQRGRWMLTGGSTGSPTKVFWKLDGHLESLRDQYWARTWWGVSPFDRQAMLWGHSHSFGEGLKALYLRLTVPLIDWLRGRRRFSAYRLDPDTLRKYYDEMAGFHPKSLYAYASAAHLLACANRGRPSLPQPLSAAFLAAEPILDSYRSAMREVFGCPAVGEYGSIECGMIAYEHPTGGYRVFERAVLVETEKDQSGYQILITQLRDTGFPLFRYEIGDVTSEPLHLSAEGFEILPTVGGRTLDLIRTPSGNVFHATVLDDILEVIPGLVLYNIHQDRELTIHFKVVTSEGQELAKSSIEGIKQSMFKALQEKMDVTVTVVPGLDRTLAGKHRWITSEAQDH
jgi:phenylacetate-CoA ligase